MRQSYVIGVVCAFFPLSGCDEERRVLTSPYTGDVVDSMTPSPVNNPISVQPGERCGPESCIRGSCLHGVCSPLCIVDGDCGSPDFTCVQRGGAGRCSKICRSSQDCADGLICAVNRMMTGFCIAPGKTQAGGSCSQRSDCASWRCAEGQCVAACDDGECSDGEKCLALHTQSVCTPIGERPAEARCQKGDECASGMCRGGRCSSACEGDACPDDRVCVQFPTLNLCERRCASSEDCGGGAFCEPSGEQRLCRTRGTEQDGAVCSVNTDCLSGRCEGRQCIPECGLERPCPAGTVCVSSVSGQHCRTAGPAPIGARCRTSAQCSTGFCAGGQCARSCPDGLGCGEDERCVQFLEGSFCFARCHNDTDCALGAFCDTSYGDDPICYWRGAGTARSQCSQHRECLSGHCLKGQCAQACVDDTDCTSRQRCMSVGPRQLCLSQPLPEMAPCTSDGSCAGGLKCQGKRCLPDCTDGCPDGSTCADKLCYPRCTQESDCVNSARCIPFDSDSPVCRDVGLKGVGKSCGQSSECASGLCRAGRCRSLCPDCAEGDVCWTTDFGAWCLTAGEGALGETCTTDEMCQSGLCVGRRCAETCPTNGCPAWTRCTSIYGTRLCVGDCLPIAGACPEGEVCREGAERWSCEPKGQETSLGQPCETSAECGPDAADCVDGVDGRRCRTSCLVDNPSACAQGEACVSTKHTDVGVCLVTGQAPVLSTCQSPLDCRSGWCFQGYLGGRCLERCTRHEDCGDGRCVDLARNPREPLLSCAPSCETNAECASPLECRRSPFGWSACY